VGSVSTYDVLHRFGTAALLRFVALVALFALLHLLRLPFLGIAAGLDAAMRRVDAATTARVSTRDPHSRNQRRARTRPGGSSRQEQHHRAGASTNQHGTGGPQW
jgi:hypothetical protein